MNKDILLDTVVGTLTEKEMESAAQSTGTQLKNQDASVYVGNLDERVTDSLLWELMIQVGPVVNVFIPKDRITSQHQGYGFCEFASAEDAEYAVKVMNMVKLFGKPLRINKASHDKRNADVGANIFVGNLAAEVDEKMLHDTFNAFGTILASKIGRDPDTGVHKGYGFVNYDSFESSDAAIQSMNGQWLCNKQLTISYAFKKDGRGERHGSAAERLLAAQSKRATAEKQQQQQNRAGSFPAMPQQMSIYSMPMIPPQQ